MNLVVTGATSFLGTALIKTLLQQGHQVYGVVRPHSSNLNALKEAVAEAEQKIRAQNQGVFHMVELDLDQMDQIGQKVESPCEIFFHFGWDGSGSDNRRKAGVQQKNVEDGIKALWGARELGCRRFVFSGSQAEYGICQTVMKESQPCRPVSEYGKAKTEFCRRAMELCRLWRERDRMEMEYIHARIFSVYGPGDHPWSLVNTCLDTFLKDGTMELGACTQQWNYLYIEDLVNGLLALACCREPISEDGIFNLAGGPESTRPLREYVEEIHRLCGGKGSCIYGKLPPNAEGQANLIPDITKLQKKTGWKPGISFEEGIKRMLDRKKTKETKEINEINEIKESKHRCIICGQELEPPGLMELTGMPASAQDIPDQNQVKDDHGITLCLHQCKRCGLVQFDCEPVGYYRDVIRSGGYSTTMANLRRSQYSHLIETYHLEGKKFLEVGCGRGEFLKTLTCFPVEAFGVEHRQELVDKAVKDGLNVVRGFAENPDTSLGNNGPYDVFLSFNFLEHQPDPGAMLDCIRNNLTESGMGLITVPSLEYILQYNGYYELLRDHIAYYTFDTLRRLLESHGFRVLEQELINRDTLSVIVRRQKEIDKEDSKEALEKGNDTIPVLDSCELVKADGLKASLEDIRRQMEELCGQIKQQNLSLAVWGASHQGFTLAATTVLKDHARYIIDSAPFKQGKFAPASHVPIVGPEHYEKEPVDVILIVAPGYTEEIADVIRSRFGTRVKILTLRSDHIEELERR